MKALIMGDIPFDGRMFTCDNCHQRSGIGSKEGTVITWPTNGKELYKPRRRTGAFRPAETGEEAENPRRHLPEYWQIEAVRPAYTDESLARVLRVGTDPAERRLDPIMPKYRLSNKNMAIMIYYLKQLSDEMSPGVDKETIQFATVVTGDVPDEKKAAMLSVLNNHIDTHNSLSRQEDKRAASGPFYKTERHHAYRKLKLHVWELDGPESTWRAQLDDYYKKQPVFGLLGGITEGSWEEIHDFSEENQIPCLFPVTDMPKISSTDWYTLYLSKGLYQEGETAAKYVRSELGMEKVSRVVQIYRQGDRRGMSVARGFNETWQQMGGVQVDDIVLQESPTAETVLEELFQDPLPDVLLVWLDSTERSIYAGIDAQTVRPEMLFSSASLLAGDFTIIPDQLRDTILITHPYSLPENEQRSRFAVNRWLQARKIPSNDFTIEAKMYFLGWMLSGGVKHLRSEFYRDYFLEGFDMMIDQDYAIAVYPRLTFGSGQRYASKGCYIVKLSSDSETGLVPVSNWITH
jgi:hypothetical protein